MRCFKLMSKIFDELHFDDDSEAAKEGAADRPVAAAAAVSAASEPPKIPCPALPPKNIVDPNGRLRACLSMRGSGSWGGRQYAVQSKFR